MVGHELMKYRARSCKAGFTAQAVVVRGGVMQEVIIQLNPRAFPSKTSHFFRAQ